MSDKYNTAAHEDPQSKSIIWDAKEQADLRRGSFKDGKKEAAPATCVSALYSEGVAEFKKKGYLVTADTSGEFCLHRIEKANRPPMIKGVNYGTRFMPYQPINSDHDLLDLERVLNGMWGDLSSEAREFWAPLVKPHRGESDLQLYTMKRLAVLRKAEESQRAFDSHHTFDPTGEHLPNSAMSPRSWVPAKSWFSASLQDVRIEDVFTIFPKAELKVLELILGRIGVGPSNQIAANGGAPIVHTSRAAAVIVGKDAGLGKSTTFDGLNAALKQCGFNISTFRSTSDRFGMKGIADSHVAYKDDTAMKSLRSFLSSEETKILITGGVIQTEEKFQATEEARAKCVIIANSNDWDPNFMYDIDAGIMDRIKPLSTYRESVLNKRVGVIGGVSADSPDLHPFNHVPWLAEKLDVDPAALFLWCVRLATDRFYELITQKDGTLSGNALKDEMQLWTSQLQIRWHQGTNASLASAMIFSMAMRDPSRLSTELTPKTLVDYLNAFYFLCVDPSTVAVDLMSKMKERWKSLGCPINHYYNGFRELRFETVRKAIDAGRDVVFSDTQTGSNDSSYSGQLKSILSLISLRDGFKISQSHVHMSSVWESTRVEEGDLREEAEWFFSQFPQEIQDRVRSGAEPCDDWMHNPNYTPERAEQYLREAFHSDKFQARLSTN